jgi:hypothetical protein
MYRAGRRVLSSFSVVCDSMTEKPDLRVLHPLKQCVLAIFWELTESLYSRQILVKDGDLEELVCLLPSAAIFQANFEHVSVA